MKQIGVLVAAGILLGKLATLHVSSLWDHNKLVLFVEEYKTLSSSTWNNW